MPKGAGQRARNSKRRELLKADGYPTARSVQPLTREPALSCQKRCSGVVRRSSAFRAVQQSSCLAIS